MSGRRRLVTLPMICAIAALAVVVSSAGALPSCTATFKPADSGGDWSVASNWNTGTVPNGSSAVACWASGTTVVLTTSITVDSIQAGGDLQLGGGSLDLSNSADASSVDNVTMWSGGVLEGPSPLAMSGSFTWTGQGELDAAITQTDGSGTCFTLNGTGQAYFTGGSVQTSCQVTIDDTGTITTGGATITTASTIDFGAGVVVGQGGATWTAAGIVGPGSGTFGFAGGELDLTSGSTTIAAGETLDTGAFVVESGQTTTIDATGEIQQENGTGQIEPGGDVTGLGSVNVASGLLTVDSGGSLTSGYGVSGGTFTAASGSTTGSSSSPVSVSSGTLNIDGAATAGNVTFTGGEIQGPAQWSVDGSFGWVGQAQYDADMVQSDGSGTCFNMTGNGQAYLTGGSITTSCQVTIDNPGTINAGNAAVTTTSTLDFGTGVVVGQGGSTFTAAGVIGPGSGTFGFDGDSLVLTGATLPGTTTITNGETLEAANLTVETGQVMTINSGGTVDQIGGGTGDIQSSGQITGAGTFEVDGGTLNVDSTGIVTSAISATGGTMNVNSGSTVGTSSSPLTVNGGTLDDTAPQTAGNVTLSGGELEGTGQLTVDGTFNWTGQAQLDPNIVQNDGSGTCFNVTGSTGQLYMTGGSIQTSCQVTIDNPGMINTGGATLTTTSTLDFGPGITVGQGGSTFTAAGVNGSGTYGFTNDTLDLTSSATSTTTVAGAATLEAGALGIGANAVLQDDGTVAAQTTLTSGGTLDGTGQVNGSVTNTSGTVAPGDAPGILRVTGNYTQGAGGTLQIADDGPGTAGSAFSQLNVISSVTLAGTLAMVPSAGYASSAIPGDSIPAIEMTGTASGTFSSITSTPALTAGESFSANYNPDEVDVVVGLAQPPTVVTGNGPVVSGTATQGDVLSTTTGSWTNNPTSFTYQWEDCTSSAATTCTNVASNGTSATYTLTSSDVGSYVIVVVSAHNAASSPGTATGTPVKGPVAALPAAPTGPKPTISGTAATGSTLTCNPGNWTGNPTFTYTWSLNGGAISGATSSTYTVPAAAAGGTITCTVTGTNNVGHTSETSNGTPIPAASPQPVTGPSVTGTPLPGDTLTCDPGTWTGNPTFSYAWQVNNNPVTGDATNTYTVTVLDEGQTITCTVFATNGSGTVKSTSGKGVVAQKGTLTCPKPSGALSAGRIGPLSLGESRTAARKALKKFTITHYGFDDFCLYGGWGIRGAYKANKFVLLLTANPFYKLAHVSVGLKISSVAKSLKIGKVIPIGLNDWYIAPGSTSNYVFKVRHGVIQEIGIANKHDTSTRALQKHFLSSFKAV